MIPKVPKDSRELEERFERIRHDTIRQADKTISGVAKEVSNQVAPTDFVAAMYAPTARKVESSSGDTASIGEQLMPKQGELLGAIEGNPTEPGQKPQTESAIGQMTIPAPEIIGAMMGSPVDSQENTSTESGIEQLLPTAGQLIGHATGSIQTDRVTPHMESAGDQIVPKMDEIAGLLGLTPFESGHAQSSATGQNSAPGAQSGPEPSGAGQSPAGQNAELDRAGIDPAMQMSQQERSTLNEEQKQKREHMMLHEREYRKFGTPLDDIGTLEEQVSKVRQMKEQEEKQKLEEEEEEKKRKEEEEKQKQQELPEPSTKPKPGDPSVAVGQSQKKTEIHRGSSG